MSRKPGLLRSRARLRPGQVRRLRWVAPVGEGWYEETRVWVRGWRKGWWRRW